MSRGTRLSESSVNGIDRFEDKREERGKNKGKRNSQREREREREGGRERMKEDVGGETTLNVENTTF